jgi:hypothetical protein
MLAWLVFVLAALTLCWPLLEGRFLAGDDQLLAGFAFRDFGATFFKQHGRIPEWNPYLFGGMPFIAGMHGDIFYPTAWLRWLVPTDVGMTLGFVLHLVIAGGAMYAFLRALGLSWTSSVVAGVAYEMSGIVASMMRPGHDGKLFVAALAPLAFLALLRAVRHGRVGGFGVLAIVIGLAMLSPHFQTTYYLLVALGIWTLWLAFADPERERPRNPIVDLAKSLGAVILGVGIGMIQGMPFLKYIPYSPRTEGSASTGWEYATSFAMPLDELASTVIPEFNGIFETYWGSNFFKTHVEYLGAIVIVLAVLGIALARRRGLFLSLGSIALLFLLVSFGGHTPFYRLWYSVMPMMDKVRAAGMAFYLVTFVVCVWAALGMERLLKGEVNIRSLWWGLGTLAGIGVMAAAGLLQPIAEALVSEPVRDRVMANAGTLRGGGLRLLLITALGGAALVLIHRRAVTGSLAALLAIGAVTADQWSVLRRYSQWVDPAREMYALDAMGQAMKAHPMPFRNFDGRSDTGEPALNLGVYQGSWLMAERIPTSFGYHGNEIRFYDELWGTKNVWQHQLSPSLWDLYAIEFITLRVDVGDQIPGYRQVMGPVSFPRLDGRKSTAGYLLQRETPARWVRVVPVAMKVPEERIIGTVIDPNFPTDQVVLYPDTTSIADATQPGGVADTTALTATLESWLEGEMRISISGSDERTRYLLVAENWHPGWQATIDGVPTSTHRANHALLSVAIPPGAREVELRFVTPGYSTGKGITAVSTLAALGLIGFGRLRRRSEDV